MPFLRSSWAGGVSRQDLAFAKGIRQANDTWFSTKCAGSLGADEMLMKLGGIR